MSLWGQIDTSKDARCRELRRCAKCSAPALTVVHVTQHYNRGLPAGRTYVHRCGSCNASFDSISWWRAITNYFFAGILTVFGFGLLSVLASNLAQYGPEVLIHGDARSWGFIAAGFALFLGGLGWSGWTTWGIARLMFLNPVADRR